MAVSLRRALMEILTDWLDDLPPQRRDACGELEFGFGNADSQLELWEPLFRVRGGRNFPRLRDRPPPRTGVNADREVRRGAVYADPDWQKLIGKIWEIEAILAQAVMDPARFAQVVAMARV